MRKSFFTIILISIILVFWSSLCSANEEHENLMSGSAIVVNKNGFLLTCAHVIENAEKITILINGRFYTSSILYVDDDLDIALLKIETSDLTPVYLGNSNDVRLGEDIRVFGFPLVDLLGENLKITKGTISGINTIGTKRVFQIDAPANPGDSGGGLVSEKGELMGIIVSKLVDEIATDVSFAIPINYIKSILHKEDISYLEYDPAQKSTTDSLDIIENITPSFALVIVTQASSEKTEIKTDTKITWKTEYLLRFKSSFLPETLHRPNEERMKELNHRIHGETDKFTGKTTFEHKDVDLTQATVLELIPHLNNDGNATLGFYLSSTGSDWLIPSKIEILADGEKYLYKVPQGKIHQDVVSVGYSPRCLESLYISINISKYPDYFEIISLNDLIKIVKSDSISIRLHGDKYYRDIELDWRKKRELEDLLSYYLWILTDLGDQMIIE